jgi:hypothetical protein
VHSGSAAAGGADTPMEQMNSAKKPTTSIKIFRILVSYWMKLPLATVANTWTPQSRRSKWRASPEKVTAGMYTYTAGATGLLRSRLRIGLRPFLEHVNVTSAAGAWLRVSPTRRTRKSLPFCRSRPGIYRPPVHVAPVTVAPSGNAADRLRSGNRNAQFPVGSFPPSRRGISAPRLWRRWRSSKRPRRPSRSIARSSIGSFRRSGRARHSRTPSGESSQPSG